MKKLINILLVVLFAVVAAFSFACNGTMPEESVKGLKIMQFKGDEYYTVYGYTDDGITSLDIGKIAQEKGVVIGRIKAGSFKGNSSLTEIIVPDTVVEIDSGAFNGIEKLEKITLPFVGAGAKADAFDGETAKSEDKVTDSERNFGYIFGTEEYSAACTVSQSFGSGDAVTYYVPNSLTEVTIAPAADYSVPMYAFYGCAQLYTVNLSEKVVAIGEKAFYGCDRLVSLNMTASVKNIYASAFENCTVLKDYDGEKGTGLNFNGCSLVKVGEKAFYKTALKTVNLSIEEIGAAAFAESSIENLTLTNVKLICENAFYKCEKLASLNVTAAANAKMYLSSFDGCNEDLVSSLTGFTIVR